MAFEGGMEYLRFFFYTSTCCDTDLLVVLNQILFLGYSHTDYKATTFSWFWATTQKLL